MGVSAISFLSGCTVLAMIVVSLLRSRGEEVKLEPRRGTPLALGGIVGGFVGRAFNKKMSPGQVDSLFRALLVIITAISCYNLWRYGGML